MRMTGTEKSHERPTFQSSNARAAAKKRSGLSLEFDLCAVGKAIDLSGQIARKRDQLFAVDRCDIVGRVGAAERCRDL